MSVIVFNLQFFAEIKRLDSTLNQPNALVRIAPDDAIRQFIQNVCGIINHYKQVAASGGSHSKEEPEPTPVDPDVTPVQPEAQSPEVSED